MLKAAAKKVLPEWVKNQLWRFRKTAEEWSACFRLARLRRRMTSKSPASEQIERLYRYTIRVNDGWNFYAVYKDIFMRRIYHFEARHAHPFILDCGSNIGGAILYYKHVYPQARIIGFEPDPVIFPYLQENVARNGLQGVRLIQAALANRVGTYTFYSDGKTGSRLAEHLRASIPDGWRQYEVPCIRLREYLTEPVDFLKMNIEGAEWDVLADSEDRIKRVSEMVIEYHHLPGLPRTLHKILALLDRRGFEYLINHFDYETNPALRPPFSLHPETRYYLLIYARRRG